MIQVEVSDYKSTKFVQKELCGFDYLRSLLASNLTLSESGIRNVSIHFIHLHNAGLRELHVVERARERWPLVRERWPLVRERLLLVRESTLLEPELGIRNHEIPKGQMNMMSMTVLLRVVRRMWP
jgi:hypothetical protein